MILSDRLLHNLYEVLDFNSWHRKIRRGNGEENIGKGRGSKERLCVSGGERIRKKRMRWKHFLIK